MEELSGNEPQKLLNGELDGQSKVLPIEQRKPAKGAENIQAAGPSLKTQSDSDSDGSSSDSEDSSDSSEIRAPIELLGEFILYIRSGKWEDAKKLCKMILIYEPDNHEALKFQPLIDEKMQLEKELAELSDESSSSEEESSDETSEEEEDEKTENLDNDEVENFDDDDNDDDDVDKRTHMRNKLIFAHKDDDNKRIWKP